MANVNMEVKVTNYGKASHRQAYRGLSAVSTFDGVRERRNSDISGKDVVSFIGESIQDVIEISISNGDAAHALTVTLPAEVTLSAGLQTHLSDKYIADPAISSVTFA